MRYFLVLLALSALLLCGCNLLSETADDAAQGGQGATGLAEKMSKGTVGDADFDSDEEEDASDDADE